MTQYSISESEWQVLACLWKQSPLEIKDILSMLQEKTGWNANMVRTLIVRLQEKGAVGAEKGGRCYRYYPIADEQSCTLAETQSFLNRVFFQIYGNQSAAFFDVDNFRFIMPVGRYPLKV